MAKLWNDDEFRQVTDKAKTGLADALSKGASAAQQIGGAVKQGATNFWNNLGKGSSGSSTSGVASYQDGGANARPQYTYENSDFQKAYDNIMNRKDFQFDLNGDALYQQYKDMYTKQGQLAMQDAMGQAAAATGGYGSSYAAAAGQQAYQQSLENLNAHIPELYQMAMQKYQLEGDNLAQQYAMLADDRDFNYQRYRDANTDWESDRAFAYQQQRDDVSDSQWERQFNESNRQWQSEFDESNRRYNQDFAYQKERDTVADSQWQQTFDRSVFESDRDYDYQVGRDAVADSQWQQTFDRSAYEYDTSLAENQRQFNANYRLNKSALSLENKKFGYQKKKDAHDYRYDKYKFDTQMDYQKKMDAHDYRYDKYKYDTTMDYQKSRDAISDEHWEKEFGLSREQVEQAKYEFEKNYGLKLNDQQLAEWIAKDNSKLAWAQLDETKRAHTLQYG